jgi:hypothetical protein
MHDLDSCNIMQLYATWLPQTGIVEWVDGESDLVEKG